MLFEVAFESKDIFKVYSKKEEFQYTYRISANSFLGNYSFLNLALFTVTFDLYYINLNSYRGNYSREETIQGRKLFAEIRYSNCWSPRFPWFMKWN